MSVFTKNKHWDWQLLLSISLYQIIPLLYNSFKIYLIGNSIPGENNLAIVAQWQFIQIVIEIIQESIVLPIFYFVGSTLKSGDIKLIERRVTTSIKLILVITLPITLLLLYNVEKFIDIINTPSEIIKSTIIYLRIKLWVLMPSICNIGLIIIIESLNKKRLLVRILIYKMLLSIIFDSLLFGGYNFSQNMGIKGVALSNLLVESILFIIIILHLKKSININIFEKFTLFDKNDFKLFRDISLGIGIESAIKNIAYFTMIVTLINLLGAKPIGGYYLSMHLFWGFLLIPIISISETSKVLIANNSSNIENIKSILKYGIKIGIIFTLTWILVIPFVNNIFNYLNPDNELIYFAKSAFYVLLLPYGLMSINMIIDSIFYGLGETKYLAYQSIITNLIVYSIAFILYKLEIWNPSFTSILILFSIGILTDSIFTLIYMNIIIKKKEQSPNKKRSRP